MESGPSEKVRQHVCADGVAISLCREVIEHSFRKELDKIALRRPHSGLVLYKNGVRMAEPIVAVCDQLFSRDVQRIITASGVRTYRFPPSVVLMEAEAFCSITALESVQITPATLVVPQRTFQRTGLRKVVLPRDVKLIQKSAFMDCPLL